MCVCVNGLKCIYHSQNKRLFKESTHTPHNYYFSNVLWMNPYLECPTCSHGMYSYRGRLRNNRVGNSVQEGRKEMFYLTTHSTHFIYGYMASDMW